MSSVVISGDTSGAITLQAPAVAGSTTLTLPATSGTVALNGPAFSAYASSTQSITATTFTKVTLGTEDFDTNSNFDTSNSRFTPTIAGYYQVTGTIRGLNTTTFTNFICSIYKNGNEILRNQISATLSTSIATQIQCSGLIYLNGSTDYIELYGRLDGSGTSSFNYVGEPTTSRMSACLVRAA